MDDQNERSKSRRRLSEYAIRELFVLCLPYMLAASIVAMILAFICYPSLDLLLYNAPPMEYQTPLTFAILLLEELRYLIFCSYVEIQVFTLQVVSFDLVKVHLQLLINSMQR